MSGKQIDLLVAYQMDGADLKEEVFSMHTEVLLGDIAAHYAGTGASLAEPVGGFLLHPCVIIT